MSTNGVLAPPLTILHLGCGRVGRNLPFIEGTGPSRVISLDADPTLEPDIVCRLGRDRIPLPDNSIDGAVAIHVLEHIGKQGETKEWFFFWEDLYRVMKPGGRLEFHSPRWDSVWAWGDPTHTRALSPESLAFFDQRNYAIEGSPISPYRINCDFRSNGFEDISDDSFAGILIAEKPLHPWWDA